MPSNIPDDGLVPAVDPTNGAPAPKVVSASAAQKANAVEGSTETSAKPSFDYEAAAQRAPGEF